MLVDLGGWILKGEDLRVLDLICDVSTETIGNMRTGEGNATKCQWLGTGTETGCELGGRARGLEEVSHPQGDSTVGHEGLACECREGDRATVETCAVQYGSHSQVWLFQFK